jgi:hypothetical protein
VTPENTPKHDETKVRFAPATAINLVMLAIMVLSIGAGLAKYFGWLVGITVGLALSYVFSALAKTVVAPLGEVTRSERVWAGLFALALFCITLGLSYGTLYAKLFAQASALEEFQRVRLPVQRQIESAVLANAEGSVKAFAAWQKDAADKAQKESNKNGGGSCPTKAASLGKRGPIAMWREADAGIAANLHDELSSNVDKIRTKFNALRDRKAANFAEAMEITTGLNAVIEASEALARGSYVRATQEALARQLASEITWLNGEVFKCGDTTRDELIKRAQSALLDLADPKKNPPLKPMAPAIDLSNEQELTIRGLLRSFNALAGVLTLGVVGTFADDPLMEAALKTKGLINRETIGFLVAGLIELSVLFTAFLAVRSGQPPFPFQPNRTLERLEARAAQEKNWLVQLTMYLALSLSKLAVNLFFAQQGDMDSGTAAFADTDRDSTIHPDPAYPSRELDWGILLAPYLLANHDGDYLVIPNISRGARALMAASALTYQGAAVRLNLEAPWISIASYRLAAEQFERLLPDARNLHYAIYKLTPAFAQAMRLQMLQAASQPRTPPADQSRSGGKE